MLVVLFCAAYTLLTRPIQVETAAQSSHFWLSVWALSCCCHVKFFSFLCSVSLAVIVFVFLFMVRQNEGPSKTNYRQRLRPAVICNNLIARKRHQWFTISYVIFSRARLIKIAYSRKTYRQMYFIPPLSVI